MPDITRYRARLPFPWGREDLEEWLGWPRGLEGRGLAGLWFPMDVLETPDEYLITAELPGVPHESVEIGLDSNVLTIQVERTLPAAPEGSSYHVRERQQGRSSRSVSLPADIDPDRVSANYANGVLEVRVAKAEASKPRKIDISTN
jgi:HSP20 family protein